MPRIVQFVNTFDIGGTERQVVNLTRELGAAGFETYLGCFKNRGGLKAEIERIGVPIAEFPIKTLKRPSILKPIYDVARFLRRNRIDVVHAQGFYPNVLVVLAARLAGTPAIIASVRDMGHMWTPTQQRVQWAIGRFAHAVVANADAVAARLRVEGWDPRRIEVVRNGIEIAPASADAADLRREIGVAPGTPLVGVVTRLTPLKGVEDFIDAAATLAPRRPDARFVIIGGPVHDKEHGAHYDRTLWDRVGRLGLADRILFTGWRSDGNDLLRQLTISVLPSLTEGLSNVLIESLAAGVPAVATRVGGNAEVVDEGVTGLLVPPSDPASLAAGIDRLLGDPAFCARLGAASRRRFEEHFTVDRMVQQMVRLYRRLLELEPAAQAVAGTLRSEREVRR
jgi:glycosyltransferase involved in cell wall biosynthesis